MAAEVSNRSEGKLMESLGMLECEDWYPIDKRRERKAPIRNWRDI
jgi:hypothetical protein